MEKSQVFNKLFVGGDLSGIQRFLYNISSKKAAVSLKGRSNYLRQLMENVCADIKRAVESNGAKAVDVIYNSGGKHPDGTIDCQDALKQKPGYLWKLVNADFAHQKSQKFKSLLTESYQDFFEPIPVGGKPKVCAVTGIESPDCVKMPAEDEDDEMFVLPSVYKQIQEGKKLCRIDGFKSFNDYAGNTNLGILRMDVDGLGKRITEGFKSIEQYKTFSTSFCSTSMYSRNSL